MRASMMPIRSHSNQLHHMKKPIESLRLVLQAPNTEGVQQLFKNVQQFVMKHGFEKLPPGKSILKIELINLCWMGTTKKPRKKLQPLKPI